MANTEKVGGVADYVIYGEESTFGTKASTITSTFGLVQSFTPNSSRNITEHRGFAGSSTSGRNPQKFTAGKFEQTLSIETRPITWAFMKYVMGSVAGSGTVASPFTYSQADSLTAITIGRNINNDTTDRNGIYLGCKINSITIRSSVGEPVNVTFDVIAADYDKSSTLDTAQNVPSGDPYTFKHASIEMPDGSGISHIIDSVEITITNNIEIQYGLGSYVGQNSLARAVEYRVNFTLKYLDETFIDDYLGSATGVDNPTENASLTVVFSQSATRNIEFRFTNLVFPEFSDPSTLNEVITEDISAYAKSLSVVEVISS